MLIFFFAALSLASAIQTPANYRGPFGCQPNLVNDNVRIMAGYLKEETRAPKGLILRVDSIPVEIHASDARGIEVFSLDPGRPGKYDPAGQPSGPRVTLAGHPVLRIHDGKWRLEFKHPFAHRGAFARKFWTKHLQAVGLLLENRACTLDEFVQCELHQFAWKGQETYLARLPLREIDADERFRQMWLFTANAAGPIPIGRAVDALRLNGEALSVDGHRVYRFEDGEGTLRYVFEAKDPAR